MLPARVSPPPAHPPLAAAASIAGGAGVAGGLAICVQEARLGEPAGDVMVTWGRDVPPVPPNLLGQHPPAGWLSVGAGAGAAGGGRALRGIAEEARFALLALGTLRVVLAVLRGRHRGWWHCHVAEPPAPRPLSPCPCPYQAVPKDLVAGAGVAMAAAARAGPQVGSLRHPLKIGGAPLARQPRVAHGAPGDKEV